MRVPPVKSKPASNPLKLREKIDSKTKKIDNTLWLDRLINQLEKQAKGV